METRNISLINDQNKEPATIDISQIEPSAWDSIAGMKIQKDLIEKKVILPLEKEDLAKKHGVMRPKAILLFGPPGTGKTTFVKGIAAHLAWSFAEISPSSLISEGAEYEAQRLKQVFSRLDDKSDLVVFIDEFEELAINSNNASKLERTVSNELLKQIPRFRKNDRVLLVCATNHIHLLNRALLRPGRFDRQIVVDWPDVKARKDILRVHVKKIKIDRNINLGNIAKGTPGMTGADLANVVNEAAILAARLNRNKVVMADFEEAKDKVMMGAARKSLVITEEEKRLIACHEAGHVLVSKFIPGADPVHKVSIIARGRALGLTHFLPIDEKHNWSYKYCFGKLTVLLGGRAAEIIKYNDMTNGAANDIENATNMARKMVCEWGMSKRLGPLAFGKKDNEIFLGREIATHKDYSEETAIAIDQEVRKFVETAQQHAESILRGNLDKLEALSTELLKHEILASDQIDRILNGGSGFTKKQIIRHRRRKPGVSASEISHKTKDNTKKDSVEKPFVKTETDKKKNEELTKETKSEEKDFNKSEKDNKNDDEFKSRRSRMIRLKIGGRRKIIRKAPAQKIRRIK